MAEGIIKIEIGNKAEDLPRGREFLHPGHTFDDRLSAHLACLTKNNADIYHDLNVARALGHQVNHQSGFLSLPIHPLVALYQAFNLTVEDLSFHSPSFIGMTDVSFGRFLYDGDTILTRTEVYANVPHERNPKVHKVGFHSYVKQEEPDINIFRTKRVIQWNRKNLIFKKDPATKVVYDPEQQGDLDCPPTLDGKVAALTPQVPTPRSAKDLELIKERAGKRNQLFYEDFEEGRTYAYPMGITCFDSIQALFTMGLRNVARVHIDQKDVEDNAKDYPAGSHRIQYGLLSLLMAAGLASTRRELTTIGEAGLNNVGFSFPVFPGSTINSVEATVLKKQNDHPANTEFAQAVTCKITARGSLSKEMRKKRESEDFPPKLAELLANPKITKEDHPNNPQVLSFEETIMLLTRK